MLEILYFIIPLLISLILTPIVRAVSIKLNLISYPRADRWHKNPTAIFGGVAIYLASVIPAVTLIPGNKTMLGLCMGATFLFLVGVADDKLHFAPYSKLFAQIIAGCIVVFSGISIDLPFNNIFSIPLTILWIVGVTNSFNLLDNIDGLAAGIAVITAYMLFVSSILLSSNHFSMFALIISGAALGFLPYNFNPAKIFMGDSGSMFLGFSLSVISIAGAARHTSNLLITMLLPVLILSVPIFDTIFVMVLRSVQGRGIFKGGNDHTSHHLVTLGLSQKKTVLLLYIVSIAFGSIAVLYSRLNVFVVSVIAILVIIMLMYFGFFLTESAYRSVDSKKRKKRYALNGNFTILNSMFFHKRRIVEFLLDFILVCIAYYSAYFLRFENTLFMQNIYLVKESLLWIILIKMSFFFAFGLYRGVWRYVSISDLITIFKVVSFSSIGSILFLTFVFRFREYSRSVFFLDWIIALFLVAGVRILFRVLGEFLSRVREKGVNVLIYGAGDTGEMVIREIKRNKNLNYNPIGFIDDDPFKFGNRIQGVKVLGSRNKIREILREKAVAELLIAIPTLEISDLSDIVKICKDNGLAYRRIRGILDQEGSNEIATN